MEQVGWFWRFRANDVREKNSKWWFSATEVKHVDDVDIINAYADPKELKALNV